MSHRVMTAEWDIHLCEDLLDQFTMFPDVRDDVITEFLKGTSLYNAILYETRAEERILETILWALKHKGNVVIELFGRQRHGKSTVGRLLSVILHGIQQKVSNETITLETWEDKVVYDRSYSSMTMKIKDMVDTWTEEGLNDEEILASIRHYVFIFDEVYIEHEKDSQKARDDLTNLLNTVAKAGIHFLFISPKRRAIGAYFSLWVVGYNEEQEVNLSFYYDPNMQCKGYLITPRVTETEKYEEEKTKGIIEMLRSGGRAVAKVKLSDEIEIPPPPTPIDVEASDSFEQYALERCLREYDEIHTKTFKLIVVDNLPQREVANNLGVSQTVIHDIFKWVRLRSLGYWFEDWWCLKEGLEPNPLKNQPLPDAIKDDIPISLKIFYDKARTYSIPRLELRPEITFAEENNTKVKLVVYNLFRHLMKTLVFESPHLIPDPISITWR